MSNNTAWDIKVVPASETCETAEEFVTAGAGVIPDNFNEATFLVTINDTFESAGKYIVCFAEDGTAFKPISSADDYYLDIGLADADLLPPEGYYMNQHFTAMAGVATTLTLKGNKLGDTTTAATYVVASTAMCDAANKVGATVALAKAADDGVTLEPLTIAAAGYYSVCVDSVGMIGDITVTQRATIGWTYVLDPEEEGSVEIISQAQDCAEGKSGNGCRNT